MRRIFRWTLMGRTLMGRTLMGRTPMRHQLIRSDRGNIESALTLIPLLLLFLAVSQVGISVYSRNTNNQRTQGDVAYAAMGSAAMGSAESPPNLRGNGSAWSTPPVALPLPGGGSVLVGVRRIQNPTLTPFLPGGESFLSTGVAVQE